MLLQKERKGTGNGKKGERKGRDNNGSKTVVRKVEGMIFEIQCHPGSTKKNQSTDRDRGEFIVCNKEKKHFNSKSYIVLQYRLT